MSNILDDELYLGNVSWIACPECEGTGYIFIDSETDTFNEDNYEECKYCAGNGEVIIEE